MVYFHHLLTDKQSALVRTVFLGKHTLCIRLFVHNPKQIHCAVSNIAEHIHTLKIPKPFCNGSETLWVDFRTDNFNAVFRVAESKRYLIVLKQILLKLRFLLTYPS